MKASPASDRRSDQRYVLAPEARCVVVVATPGNRLNAQLRDVSTGGVGLVLEARVEPGALVHVELSNRSGLFARSLPLLVVHVAEMDSGQYLIGGAFGPERLSTDEVRALLS